MLDIGRICIKIAGRDAGQHCVVIKRIDDTTVIIDGGTRRKKCNIRHLEPTGKTLNISEEASHDIIVKTLGDEGITLPTKGDKRTSKGQRPKREKKSTKK